MSKKITNKVSKEIDSTKEEIDSLKRRLSDDSSVKETTKKKVKKELSEEELQEKKKKHFEKIVKKQEARLSKHIERVSSKEAKGPAVNKERFYVTNAKLLEQLNIWKNSGPTPEERIIPEEFGKMILMIAQRLSNHSNFKNYSYELKQDMISYACFKCMQGLRNYNFAFKNAFAYFTTACYNSFVSTITQHYKQINLKRDLAKKAIKKLEATANINASKVLSKFVKEYIGEEEYKKNENTEEIEENNGEREEDGN